MHCNVMIPAGSVPDGPLRVDFEFGFSNKGQDIDGPIKVCLDILQEKFKFNDNRVYEMNVTKRIVKKGEEYWAFTINEA